ncbi:MAG: Ig-like domain-containing protein [Deltaproteobacteria bacterium]|nr:Ig-like domain-containing protein [Deltaproteobacteria bacterium]
MRKPIHFAIALSSLIACDTPYADQPAVDPNAPRVHITSPERGTFAGTGATVEVKGTATDDTSVTSVEVNGVTAIVQADGSWAATVPVAAGTNLLHAIAKDAQGNTGKETRAVVAGPTSALDKTIEQAITATISAQTFDALGRGASELAGNADLTSLVTPINPVVDMGTTNGVPDCLYGQAHVTGVDLGATTQIRLIPTSGGLMLDADLDNARVDAHLQWAVSCFDGSRNVAMTASRIHIGGLLAVGQDFFGNIVFTLESPDISITNFNVDLGGVPQTIIDMLDLDTRLGPVLAWATEKFVVPMLNDSLAGLNQTKTLDVFGKQVDVTLMPSRVDFSLQGAAVILDTEIRAQGDSGNFVYVPNTLPAMDLSQGFQLAIADDSANQLLTSLWSAKALDLKFDLSTGPYGEIGQLYDSVELSAKVPPWLDASSGKLKLVVGDLMASFKNGEQVVTQVSINAEVELSVTADPTTGALRLDVGQPKAFVDVLDDQIDGANALSNAQFEAISSFALSRVVAVGSGAVGAIPLPSAGGVSVKNVSVSQQTGYLVVDGEIQ